MDAGQNQSKEKIYSAALRIAVPVIAAAVIVSISALLLSKEKAPELVTYTVKRQNIEITCMESGEIRAINNKQVGIMRPRSGPIIISSRDQPEITFLIPEGTKAQPGDTLLKLNPAILIEKRETYEAELESELVGYEDVKKSNELADQKVRRELEDIHFSIEARRIELKFSQLSSENEKLQKELGLKIALLDSVEKVMDIEGQKIDRLYKLKQAEKKVRNAQNKVKAVEKQLKAFTIIADYTSVVMYAIDIFTRQKIAVGDKPDIFRPLLQLPDFSRICANMIINDIDRGHVWIGQKGRLIIDSYPDREFFGEVISMTPIPQTGANMFMPTTMYTNIKTFEAQFEINGSDELFKPGMSASIELFVDRLQDVIAIPFSSVFVSDNTTCVYFVHDGITNIREIVLGKRNALMVEVKGGLNAGDDILKNSSYGGSIKSDIVNVDYDFKKQNEFNMKHFKAAEELGILYDYDTNRDSGDKAGSSDKNNKPPPVKGIPGGKDIRKIGKK